MQCKPYFSLLRPYISLCFSVVVKFDRSQWGGGQKFSKSCQRSFWLPPRSKVVKGGLRAGWVLIVIGAIGVAIFFLWYSVDNFISSTVMTTQDTSR